MKLATSIHFGSGVPKTSGPGQGLHLIVGDIEAARVELTEHGADVSGRPGNRAAGPDRDRRSYASYATFTDPDGNSWVLPEVTTRLPGR